MPRRLVVDSADTCNDGALRTLTDMVVLVAAIRTCVPRKFIVGVFGTLISSVVTGDRVVVERDISFVPKLNALVVGAFAPNRLKLLLCWPLPRTVMLGRLDLQAFLDPLACPPCDHHDWYSDWPS